MVLPASAPEGTMTENTASTPASSSAIRLAAFWGALERLDVPGVVAHSLMRAAGAFRQRPRKARWAALWSPEGDKEEADVVEIVRITAGAPAVRGALLAHAEGVREAVLHAGAEAVRRRLSPHELRDVIGAREELDATVYLLTRAGLDIQPLRAVLDEIDAAGRTLAACVGRVEGLHLYPGLERVPGNDPDCWWGRMIG
jgi:hypothetical protein